MISTSARRVVSVSGAAGSLGRALVARLSAGGYTVRSLVRRTPDASELSLPDVVPVRGDLRDLASLAKLVEGSEVVFHLAAWIMSPFDPALAHEVNVEGTRQLVRAAAKAGCKRVVFASSIAVYGPKLEGTFDENAPFCSVGDPYGDSKIDAEKAAREEAAASGVELVILRPTLIYGPASPPFTLVPFGFISKGLPAIIGSGEDLADAVYVDDVAHAFELAGFAPGVAGEAFNIGSGAPVTWNEFFGHYARMCGKKLRRLPAGLARTSTQIGAFFSRLVGKTPRTQPEMVGVMTSQLRFSVDKAKRLLGWQPEVTLEEGMRRTERWLKDAGLLRRASVAVVTGAASGLGRATAKELRARGLTVWATDMRPADLAPLAELGIRTLPMDVSSDASVAAAMAEIERESGIPDVVVNVAGIMRPGPLEVQPMSELESQFSVNALGPIRVARTVSEKMRRRRWGRIVNISSTNGFVTTPFNGGYCASKHAVEAFSNALRMEMRPWGVDVVVVQPAAMATGIAERARASLRAAWAEDRQGWKAPMHSFIDSGIWYDDHAEPVERIARLVARVSLQSRPPRRVRAMQAHGSWLLSLLPSAITDRIFNQIVGLNRAALPAPAEAKLALGPGSAEVDAEATRSDTAKAA